LAGGSPPAADRDGLSVGDPSGYAELLKAIDDPKLERHAQLSDWIECDFDSNVVDADGLTETLTQNASLENLPLACAPGLTAVVAGWLRKIGGVRSSTLL
jgi:hypothetical protein